MWPFSDVYADCLGFFLGDPINREAHHLPGITEAKLLLDVGTVGLDGFDAKMKLSGDLLRSKAAAEKLQDLEFAIGKPVHRRSTAAFRRLDGLKNQAFAEARVT